MKHFKFDLRSMRSPLRARPKTVVGTVISEPESLRRLYKRGPFFYQFCAPLGRSRVMLCDNDPELVWLCRQISSGSSVITEYC